MKPFSLAAALIAIIPSLACADVEPVAMHIPEATAWTGQRVSFFVELRAPGTGRSPARRVSRSHKFAEP